MPTRDGITSNYTYDPIYELTQVTQGASTTETYSYDPVGNRLSSSAVPNYNYNVSNELTSNSNGSYTYDANGNTLSDPSGKSYTWDFENRLTQAIVPGTNGGTTTFKYDPFGRRIEKISPNFTSVFVYDGPNLIETTNGSGSEIASYMQTREIDTPLAESRGGTADYYEQDGLGSITSLSSSAGAVANTYTYDSFGNLTNSTGTLRNPFQYTAREFDTETGIYYYRERYYDPVSGRFLSEDPLRFKTNVNFYPYAVNDPTRFNDPMGLSAQDVQRIFGACQNCTDQLTKNGERLAGTGWPSDWANNIISSLTLGRVFSGCTRQADLTASCLNFPSSPYDSQWNFTVESTEWGFHHVTMGRSNDPSDPIIICDPWRNTHYTVPSGPGSSGGGGFGGGGGKPF